MRWKEQDLCEVSCIHPEKVESAREVLPSADDLRQRADYFRLLGEPTRLRMLYALSAGELCVCDLSALLEASPSAVSHQLRLLRTAGLVHSRKAGRMVYYALDRSSFVDLLADAGRLSGERPAEGG